MIPFPIRFLLLSLFGTRQTQSSISKFELFKLNSRQIFMILFIFSPADSFSLDVASVRRFTVRLPAILNIEHFTFVSPRNTLRWWWIAGQVELFWSVRCSARH